MRSVRRDVETGLQTGVETVVKYIQTVQTIKLKILIKYTLSRSLYGLYVIHSSLYPGLYPGLYPVSTSETSGAGQHKMLWDARVSWGSMAGVRGGQAAHGLVSRPSPRPALIQSPHVIYI